MTSKFFLLVGRETHERPSRTTRCEFMRSMRTDVSSSAASCSRVVHRVAWNKRCFLFFHYVSCLLDIRAELVMTSLRKAYISSCSATSGTFEDHLVANDIRGSVEIMTIHRPVLLPSSNTAKFSYRDGWHGCEYRSSSLLSVSRMGFQTHAANKFNTDKSSLDFLVASMHLNGANRKATPVFSALTLL